MSERAKAEKSVAERIREYLTSPEGRASVQKALEEAEEMTRQFREASAVDWASPDLRRPLDAARRLMGRRLG